MEFKIQELLSTSENDFESFAYMEIDRVHKPGLLPAGASSAYSKPKILSAPRRRSFSKPKLAR